jgi:hypothetical protein
MPFMENGRRSYKKEKKWSDVGRVCSVCGKFHDWNRFSWKKSKRYKDRDAAIHQLKQPKCKECAIKETRDWYNKNKDVAKNTRLFSSYGITLNEYKARLLAQNYTCPICNKQFSDGAFGPDSPVVDHCHINGHIRGIICNECNRGLGYFRDMPEALMNAAQYLLEDEQSLKERSCSCLL